MPFFLKKTTKNNKKSGKKRNFIYIFIIFLLICVVIFNVCDIMSSVITKKKGLFFVDKIDVPSFQVYAVSVADYDNLEEANSMSDAVKSKGGMGEIYQSGEFYLIASIFPTLIEAKEIQENLKNLNYNSKIVNLSAKEILIDYHGNSKTQIVDAIYFFRESFMLLYEKILEYDSGKILRTEVDSACAFICSNALNFKKNLDNLDLNKLVLEQFNNSFNEVYEAVNDCIYFEQNSLYYNSKIKSALLKIALNYKNISNIFA